MIASLVAPILWLGALERFSRWQNNRNTPAGAALLTAVALAVMVTVDTPAATDALVHAGLVESEVITVQRLLLLVACVGALVFALALDGSASRPRIVVRIVPVFVAMALVVGNAVLVRHADPTLLRNSNVVGLALETALVYGCLMVTALVVALSSWRASQRTRMHRPQLLILAGGGAVLAVVAVANVIAGGFLLQHLRVGVWALRLNRLMLDAGFASWALVLMASWLVTALVATREWFRYRPAYEQVRELFPDLEAVVRPGGGWVELVDARAGVVLDGWALLARPGDSLHSDAAAGERARAVATWLDQITPYGSITAADLAPPAGWRTARWVSAVTSRAQHTTSPLMERVR
ncbi:putative protein OS=Tsukamurella paurometabola (strain ATCC 8368 / DSM / CCUG 35730 /CIP 100753 / JCM 10117 / KCTC 9821 / NBRC 16120 / NCIMB 702349/ NCTC 13040) OX=521096 GN=Tpau_4135 PE=4 SV=1 [Tsukamurella paurometabola]|uniref:Uncharacterized protein n=1 Tax=Tsukamurella paurometabola (strain ATCC 8368 / DSM 20162 / CCUG 35730 / CIP 100753 / JCM 10117 / KCTC 9821 / NBRC 16120 / NCIMB 702349 / NCTC 13040) TaxID=521096 RepID=D5UNZ5_TSUPD|nr:hypothetical protein [Tsukamurella paurometabola]ADG80704.1 hypothetical protein Tpau_4135 [Tsukamurella paurometabola DSM 20162]SUP40634.1 Uncharacterised protein [Tsukamurella paurometabola]